MEIILSVQDIESKIQKVIHNHIEAENPVTKGLNAIYINAQICAYLDILWGNGMIEEFIALYDKYHDYMEQYLEDADQVYKLQEV